MGEREREREGLVANFERKKMVLSNYYEADAATYYYYYYLYRWPPCLDLTKINGHWSLSLFSVFQLLLLLPGLLLLLLMLV